MSYADFVFQKLTRVPPTGIEDALSVDLPDGLFDFQECIVRWALGRGRAAIFADTGLGKSRMQLSWANAVNAATGHDVLILAPLAVAAQTVEEGQAIGVTVKQCKDGAEVEPGITITNYDRLHRFDTSRFGGVVLDECFAADTMIDCEFGRKRIQDIRKGDRILNASGVDSVADIHRREVPYGVKVKSQGQHFIASPNHPIFTQRGWVGAQDLRPRDYALATGAAMSLVRGDVHTKGPGAEGSAFLRDILLSEMADEHAGAQSEGAQAGDVCKDPCEAHGMAGVGLPDGRERVGADTPFESYIRPECQGENLPHIESHEAQSFRAWGQWDWADGSAGIHDGCTWRRLDSGICFVTGPTASGLSDTLQAGLGESSTQNRSRAGWELALREESAGREERRQAGFIRLDGVEILESGHPELERYRDADGKLYFYDLGATRHPSFSVNGLLVHNSSVIKHHTSKTLQILLEAFEQTPFKLCATATPAPNDWTELGTHAQFLGVCTQVEMLSEYFVHDSGETQKWRLKGHAREQFWRWVASWAALVRKPEDLGFNGDRYRLPALHVRQHTTPTTMAATEGMLFALEANTLSERLDARRASLGARIDACASLIKSEWSKLAETENGTCHGLETEARGGTESEGGNRSGIPCQAERAIDLGQGIPEVVHEEVLRAEPGQVQTDAGAERGAQCGAAGEVCGERGVAGEVADEGQGLAGREPGKAEESSVEGSRDRTERLSGHAGNAERGVRDLRALGHEQSEYVSGRGSLPREGNDSRPALHELQSGAGQVQGRSDAANACGGVPIAAWVIWCELNSEQDALERHFGKLAFSVRGSMTPEEKESAILGWLRGERPVMISKPSIMGWGINAQHCARMAFVGVTDSWESYYQAVRRCWRFGQRREVEVHIFASDLEGAVVANLQRKEADAMEMAEALSIETRGAVMEAVTGSTRMTNTYLPKRKAALPSWIKTED